MNLNRTHAVISYQVGENYDMIKPMWQDFLVRSASQVMSISRTSMPFQISRPPEGRRLMAKKKKKKLDACAKKGKGAVQGVAQRIRKRSGSQVPKSGGRKLGKLY